ncbi:hypothetical protein VPH35_138136 [Triticum aestivum]
MGTSSSTLRRREPPPPTIAEGRPPFVVFASLCHYVREFTNSARPSLCSGAACPSLCCDLPSATMSTPLARLHSAPSVPPFSLHYDGSAGRQSLKFDCIYKFSCISVSLH